MSPVNDARLPYAARARLRHSISVGQAFSPANSKLASIFA
jgi:hypothetical protein